MLDWLGVPAAAIAFGFALYVFVLAPRSPSASLLVAMLIVDGIAVISGYGSWAYADALLNLGILNWFRIHQASDWLVITVYLAFLGATVRSPLVRPFADARVRTLLLVVGSALALAMWTQDEQQLTAMMPPLYTLIAVVLTWGFASAVHSWVIARDRATRARARAFTIAFGLRDMVWMATFVAVIFQLQGYYDESSLLARVVPVLYSGAVIVYVPLVAYGMLRTQLFDIDLRVKRTLKRSTVVAAFVAVFFMISALAELFLSNALGNLLGIICTSALVFFLDPIQRAAERLADAAMPKTRDTPEYEAYRKLQVYESALQASLEQGAVPDHKRPVLDALIDSLGIDRATAQRLEADARAASA